MHSHVLSKTNWFIHHLPLFLLSVHYCCAIATLLLHYIAALLVHCCRQHKFYLFKSNIGKGHRRVNVTAYIATNRLNISVWKETLAYMHAEREMGQEVKIRGHFVEYEVRQHELHACPWIEYHFLIFVYFEDKNNASGESSLRRIRLK